MNKEHGRGCGCAFYTPLYDVRVQIAYPPMWGEKLNVFRIMQVAALVRISSCNLPEVRASFKTLLRLAGRHGSAGQESVTLFIRHESASRGKSVVDSFPSHKSALLSQSSLLQFARQVRPKSKCLLFLAHSPAQRSYPARACWLLPFALL